MIAKLSEHITEFLLHEKSFSEEEREVYQYGIEITLSSILNIVFIVLISLILKELISGILFLICFIAIRKYTGGYHAESYFRCNTVFAITYILVLIFSRYIGMATYVSKILLLIGFMIVAFCSPVQNIHKKLEIKEKAKYKKLALVWYVLATVVSFVITQICSYHGTILIYTLLSIVILIIIEIYMQRRGYHES